MKTQILAGILLAFVATPAFSKDYLLHSRKVDETKLSDEEKKAVFVYNSLEGESLFGGFSVSQSNGAQLTQINLLNYHIRLGDNVKVPFQLFISPSVAGSSGPNNPQSANQAKLLDPQSGTAVRFPALWTYNGDGGGLCSFMNHDEGRCDIGFDITTASKKVTATDGTTQSPTQLTAKGGASFRFPVFDNAASVPLPDGYLAGALRLGYTHYSGISDSSQLFIPVLDSNGNPIRFQNSLKIYEMSLSLVVSKKVSVSGRLVGSIRGSDYLKRQTSVTLDSLF